MNIDGKQDVKERKEIQKTKFFTTYQYIFENGNFYNESKPEWVQTSKEDLKGYDADKNLRNHYWERG